MLYTFTTHTDPKYTKDYVLYFKNHGVVAYLNLKVDKYILPIGTWLAL